MSDSGLTRDYGLEAQQAAEAHLAECWAAMEHEGEDVVILSPVSAPFCGCQTCEVRETLFAAWPFLVEAVKAGAS